MIDKRVLKYRKFVENIEKPQKEDNRRLREEIFEIKNEKSLKRRKKNEKMEKNWPGAENGTEKGKDVQQGHVNRPRQYRLRLPVQTQRANHDKDDIKRKKKKTK
jgi:hypothetical protein